MSISCFQVLIFRLNVAKKLPLIGNNGTGKTTILKIINGIVDADAGEGKSLEAMWKSDITTRSTRT